MLDVKDSINRLQWTVDHHFLHIQAQHEFMRAWAVQFEMAYTDFRMIQIALQLGGEENHPLLKEFAAAYEDIYQYEYEFAAGGLEGFNAKFGAGDLDKYQAAVKTMDGLIEQIKAVKVDY